MLPTRTDRLANEFRQEIATIIHQELKDPGIGFVTMTRVELSKDVSHAKVFFSCLGEAGEEARSQEALNRSGGFIRSLLTKRFRLKMIPELHFHYDASIADSIEMTGFLDRLKPSPRRSSDA